MRILLDTHSFLWFSTDNEKLSAAAKNLIEDPGNEIFLSVVVGWEIAIKASLGKLSLAQPVDVILNRALQSSRWKLLGIEVRHLGVLSTLPFHHRDPFDRLLVAQSMVDDLPFVSNDVKLDDYGVSRQW